MRFVNLGPMDKKRGRVRQAGRESTLSFNLGGGKMSLPNNLRCAGIISLTFLLATCGTGSKNSFDVYGSYDAAIGIGGNGDAGGAGGKGGSGATGDAGGTSGSGGMGDAGGAGGTSGSGEAGDAANADVTSESGGTGGTSGSGGTEDAGGAGGTSGSGGTGGCSSGFGDCDDDPSDCETNLQTDIDNCGECDHGCSDLPDNATATECAAGACDVTTCAVGYKDCNYLFDDGCEHDVADGRCVQLPKISVGYDHACALTGDGRVVCWGDAGYGELGYGGTVDYRRGSIYVKNLSDATQVESGETHTCALKSDGSVACWGRNNVGQLGNNSTTDSPDPVQVSGITGAIQVESGQQFSCALLDSGEVRCWGAGANGRLGNGGTSDQHIPVAVSAGETGSGNLSQAVWIGLGWQHACAVLDNGRLVCWGYGSSGQIGDNATSDRSTPVYVHGLDGSATCTSADQSGCMSKVIVVAGGENTTVAIHEGGRVSSWGSNSNGESGNGNSSNYPKRVTGVGGTGTLDDATRIAMGGDHGCAVRSSGQAVCWGAGGNGRLGNNGTANSAYPVAVSGSADYTEISAGYQSTCAMRAGGAINCWGSNSQGQVGEGTLIDRTSPTPNDHGSGFIAVDGGDRMACGVTSPDGSVYCWGSGSNGGLGNGATDDTWSPVKVSGIANAIDVAAGRFEACAVLSSGKVNCWGYGCEGQMGNGAMNCSNNTPVEVSSLTSATQIAGGYRHFCALTSDETVFCWGWNSSGQLGDNSSSNRSTPVQVKGVGGAGNLTGVVAVGAGGWHSCAVRSDGTVVCWGVNDHGECGDNTTFTPRSTPVTVLGTDGKSSLNGIKSGKGAIDGGWDHSCAVAADGKAYCWGRNANGQLGNNSTTPVSHAIQVSTITDFTQISTGLAFHSCGLRSDGSVYCWGYNGTYAIGDNTNADRHVPTAVVFSTAATTYGNTDFNSPVVFMSTGGDGGEMNYSVSYAVHQNGAISSWGDGSSGQRGNGWSAQNGVPAEVSPTP
jgi:alpha-tubulin suppressor-like RCC1 family protein